MANSDELITNVGKILMIRQLWSGLLLMTL